MLNRSERESWARSAVVTITPPGVSDQRYGSHTVTPGTRSTPGGRAAPAAGPRSRCTVRSPRIGHAARPARAGRRAAARRLRRRPGRAGILITLSEARVTAGRDHECRYRSNFGL
eukprot:635888-Hanusia_phi.AAC.1